MLPLPRRQSHQRRWTDHYQRLFLMSSGAGGRRRKPQNPARLGNEVELRKTTCWAGRKSRQMKSEKDAAFYMMIFDPSSIRWSNPKRSPLKLATAHPCEVVPAFNSCQPRQIPTSVL